LEENKWDLDGYYKIDNTTQGIFLTVEPPIGNGKKVEAKEILNEIKERGLRGIDTKLVKQTAIESLGIPVKIGQSQEEKKQAMFQIELLEDEMKAYLTLIPPRRFSLENKITPEELKNILKEKGIIYGYQEENILEICRNPKKYIHKSVLIAKGTSPTKGKDALIEFKFKKEKKSLKEDEEGRVNYKELDLIDNVQKGELLAVKIPPTKGKAGMTVTGVEISPLEGEGKDIPLPSGKNTYISDNGLELYAACSGRVIYNGSKIDVESIYEIKGDVNYDTGNIEFIGTVIVGGNVKDGFSIKASGNVEIKGCIEKAKVEAEKDIRVEKGILGKGEGYVKAGGDIYAKFIENATVEAGKDIMVSEAIMHSNVDAGREVVVYGKKKGVILGGKIRAKELVEANTIGSISEVETHIQVGIDPHAREDTTSLEREIATDKKNFEEIKLRIKNLVKQREEQKGKFPQAKEELLTQLIKSRNLVMMRLRDSIERLNSIKSQFSLHGEGRIRVSNIVYPGVIISIKDANLPIKSEYKYVTFTLKSDQIRISPYE
jgi:hypothetical protein